VPAAQFCPTVQARLHAPQFMTSVAESTHARLQASSPPGQPQTLFVQTWLEPQALLQLPQFAMSLVMFLQTPLHMS
jgi:hypothetical protein